MRSYKKPPEYTKTADPPLISFCVPTCRRKDLLSAALKSILFLRGLPRVTYEIIVSDDEESGDLRAELSPETTANGAVRIYKNQVHGQFFNLNNLIEKSSGEWLVFLHDDDLLNPDFLEKLMDEKLLDDSCVEAIWFARQLIDHGGRAIRQVSARKKSSRPVRIKGIDYVGRWLTTNDATFGGTVIPPMVTGLVVRKNLLQRVGCFPTHLTTMSDGLFLFKALSEADEVCYIDEPMVLYRFYMGTQRSLASEQGHVYHEYKTHFLEAVEFAASRVELERHKFVAEAKIAFYRGALGFNGPITWLALHYRGNMRTRKKLISEIFNDVRGNSPMLLIKHFPFVPLILHLLPSSLNKSLTRIYFGYFGGCLF
ncbi:MAG: glycosyltransferase family 2 protein [Burkholderiales bacterium]|nr:glycosyltransferase family 2 protein [Burkholderiales bacterium]MBY0576486.1 glycosyltransferase family 2 protein [Gallionellaceae bacterium]